MNCTASLDRVGEWMRLMTKQYGPRDLREACAMPREDAVWFMEHCAEAWEADRQRLEAAEKELDCVVDALDEAGAPQGTDEEIEGMMSERYYSLAERIAALAAGEEKP